MCGRARLSSDVSEIKIAFEIPPERPTPNVAPSWNVAPTDPLPIVYYDAKAGTRDLEVMRWGLIPYWAKDIERIRSFTIVTTTPNELCAELHNRMPVVLKPQAWPVWLGEQPTGVPQLKSLLAPYPADDMICWPVSARVGNVKNNDPSLIEPVSGMA
jgi:putative SOS response-associated peptidase YedK